MEVEALPLPQQALLDGCSMSSESTSGLGFLCFLELGPVGRPDLDWQNWLWLATSLALSRQGKSKCQEALAHPDSNKK